MGRRLFRSKHLEDEPNVLPGRDGNGRSFFGFLQVAGSSEVTITTMMMMIVHTQGHETQQEPHRRHRVEALKRSKHAVSSGHARARSASAARLASLDGLSIQGSHSAREQLPLA